jgi:hypothetical protein
LNPLLKAWMALGAFAAYALTAATLYVANLGSMPVARGFNWSAIVLHVIAASTCYAYLSTLECRSCGVGLAYGAMGLGRRCRHCGGPISGQP